MLKGHVMPCHFYLYTIALEFGIRIHTHTGPPDRVNALRPCSTRSAGPQRLPSSVLRSRSSRRGWLWASPAPFGDRFLYAENGAECSSAAF